MRIGEGLHSPNLIRIGQQQAALLSDKKGAGLGRQRQI
jgi:hypothetical protein